MTSIRDTYAYDPYYVGSHDHPAEDPYDRASEDLGDNDSQAMLAQTAGSGQNQAYSSVPRSSTVPRQQSVRYMDNPSYIPSQSQPRTNQSASYGTYDGGNPFADPASPSDRYYSHGSAQYSDPEKYSRSGRMFGMKRRNFFIIVIVVAAVIVALIVAAAVKNVSHIMKNSTSSTNALGDDVLRSSSSTVTSSATSSARSAAPTVFAAWYNSTNATYIYPNSTVSASTTVAPSPSSNVSIHFYF
ncbi:hypothetical protein V1525DRAFT_377616 [Lipomyces kononenkoae]|uniref:Uncharacterized protein n=1 Tax=Lipomyces kononenkoae TaxID=34357 RepID=A0ACC3T094_LIPKO